MLDLFDTCLILVVVLAASMLFMAVLNRVWANLRRSEHNNLIAWQLSLLSTPYAVILGFMLVTVWNSYGQANTNVGLEANSVRTLYRFSQALPDAQRDELMRETRDYTDVVIDRDWPMMSQGKLPEQSHRVNEAMWNTLLTAPSATPFAVAAQDHALSELTKLTEYRRTRLLQSTARLPGIFWVVLIVGAVVTIASASLFGTSNVALHIIQVFFYTLLVTLVLLAIADVNRPFSGWVHVSDYPFIRARLSFRESALSPNRSSRPGVAADSRSK